mgnify:CR=1 FL=1
MRGDLTADRELRNSGVEFVGQGLVEVEVRDGVGLGGIEGGPRQPTWTGRTAGQTALHEGYHGKWGLQPNHQAARDAEVECWNQ